MPLIDGYIYFIEANLGLIKIGYSDYYPCRRFLAIQAMSPVPLRRLGYLRGGREDERRLHAQFSRFRERGEWFRAARELTDFIAANAIRWDIEKRAVRKLARGERAAEIREWDATLERFEKTGELYQ